jgi:acyl-homoserine lactone synthase
MIHVIDYHSQAPEQPLLRSMFADRKRLFVDLFGWDVPVVDGQLEIDQFDAAGAIYIIVADAPGQHQASIRLLPSTRPHVLDTLFPHLCPVAVSWRLTMTCASQGARRCPA